MVQQELEALDAARRAALADLDRLAAASTDPSPGMVEQVAIGPSSINFARECQLALRVLTQLMGTIVHKS